ncbi:MAG: hypothetical protein MUC83_19365 [Pirellula sp.]|nr:hypothetical protein [Pirellula sp.]
MSNSGLKGWDYSEINASQDLFWNFDTRGGIDTASILVTWNADYVDANGNFSVSDFRLATCVWRSIATPATLLVMSFSLVTLSSTTSSIFT